MGRQTTGCGVHFRVETPVVNAFLSTDVDVRFSLEAESHIENIGGPLTPLAPSPWCVRQCMLNRLPLKACWQGGSYSADRCVSEAPPSVFKTVSSGHHIFYLFIQTGVPKAEEALYFFPKNDFRLTIQPIIQSVAVSSVTSSGIKS